MARHSKYEVDKVRVRVLETAKCQLNLRLKTISVAHKHVIFGALIYGKCCFIITCMCVCRLGFSFEFYVVRFMDKFYPYEKISWGQLPRLNCLNPVLENTLCSILTLKVSINNVSGHNNISSKHRFST